MGSRFLSYDRAHRLPDYRAVVYAFPLDDRDLDAYLETMVSQYARMDPYTEMTFQVEDKLATVWPAKKISFVVVHTDKGRDEQLALSVVICTKPNAEFIPGPEDLQKLKDILADLGFRYLGKPRWYWMRP